MRLFKRILFALLFITVGVVGYFYWQFRNAGVPNDLKDPVVVTIPTGSSYEDVVAILQKENLIGNEMIFHTLAERMNYKREEMRSGRFKIKGGWTPIKLIRHLRNGPQEPVSLVINNVREPIDVAKQAAKFIEVEADSIIALLQDSNYIGKLGYTKETLMSLFIPNSYEFFWNTTAEGFMQRMVSEHNRFWTEERLKKAEERGLNQAEVYTLASIVEKETLLKDERRRMAGVYLNRLEQGMKLQADPTSVFATRDFRTRRVTNYHIKFDSPYNTYKYTGLPPGPIYMASLTSLEGVLNAEQHDYIFFCAVGDGTSRHNFAETHNQHIQNKKIYKRNLRQRGLR